MKKTRTRTIGHTGRKPIRSANHDIYTRREKFPKWSGTVTPLEEYRLLRSRLPEFTKADHVNAAKIHWQDSVKQSEAHQKVRKAAIRKYGMPRSLRHNPWAVLNVDDFVSGGVSKLFPATVNDKLRRHAHAHGAATLAAFAHWQAAGKRSGYWTMVEKFR